MAKTTSKPLTFKELAKSAKFIPFPMDGDDSGHGGFRQGHHLFMKISHGQGKEGENAVRVSDGALIEIGKNLEVVLVT